MLVEAKCPFFSITELNGENPMYHCNFMDISLEEKEKRHLFCYKNHFTTCDIIPEYEWSLKQSAPLICPMVTAEETSKGWTTWRCARLEGKECEYGNYHPFEYLKCMEFSKWFWEQRTQQNRDFDKDMEKWK